MIELELAIVYAEPTHPPVDDEECAYVEGLLVNLRYGTRAGAARNCEAGIRERWGELEARRSAALKK